MLVNRPLTREPFAILHSGLIVLLLLCLFPPHLVKAQKPKPSPTPDSKRKSKKLIPTM